MKNRGPEEQGECHGGDNNLPAGGDDDVGNTDSIDDDNNIHVEEGIKYCPGVEITLPVCVLTNNILAFISIRSKSSPVWELFY